MNNYKPKISKMKERFVDLLPDADVCLLGLQGSRALGLAMTDDADYDYRGVYVAKNRDLLALENKAQDQFVYCDARDDEMDYVIYEVGKFMNLCLKGNPSVLHIFYTPEINYKNDVGNMLLANREVFLGEKPIRKAFGGYAMSQILYLKRNHKLRSGLQKRKEKHLRHCFRLFDTGQELLETGNITMPLKDPQKYIELSKIEDEDKLFRYFEQRDKEFQKCKSILPEKPNRYMANKLLLKIRFELTDQTI